MPDTPKPLLHKDAEKKEDEVLRKEARTHLSLRPAAQLMAELLTKLRAMNLPWWTPSQLRDSWTATERMGWFQQRPDVRQQITTALTGLAPKAARKMTANFQAGLLDSVLDEGDISPRQFEEAFDPSDVAIYGPLSACWHQFRARMPWQEDKTAHQELIAWLLKALLADKSTLEGGFSRRPILSHWDVRTAINSTIWHTRIPVEIRAAIDDARFAREREKSNDPFHAAHDLSIASPEIITAHILLRDLTGVLDAAEKAMAFTSSPVEVSTTVQPVLNQNSSGQNTSAEASAQATPHLSTQAPSTAAPSTVPLTSTSINEAIASITASPGSSASITTTAPSATPGAAAISPVSPSSKDANAVSAKPATSPTVVAPDGLPAAEVSKEPKGPEATTNLSPTGTNPSAAGGAAATATAPNASKDAKGKETPSASATSVVSAGASANTTSTKEKQLAQGSSLSTNSNTNSTSGTHPSAPPPARASTPPPGSAPKANPSESKNDAVVTKATTASGGAPSSTKRQAGDEFFDDSFVYTEEDDVEETNPGIQIPIRLGRS